MRLARTRTRRIDLAIGALVSTGAFVGLVLLSGKTEERAASIPQTETPAEVVALEIPDIEETPVEISDSAPAESLPPEMSMPNQAELPGVVSIDSFVQVMQAPVPAGLSTGMEMLTVPPARGIGQGTGPIKLFEMSELDRIPSRIRTVAPEYPSDFKRARVEGDVLLLVVIEPSGRVAVERVLETTAPEFARAAIAAAEQCRFESPMKGGVTVSARYRLRVPFRLNTVAALR